MSKKKKVIIARELANESNKKPYHTIAELCRDKGWNEKYVRDNKTMPFYFKGYIVEELKFDNESNK